MELIEESDQRPDPALDDDRRKYFRLTGVGRRVTKAETERLAVLVQIAQYPAVLLGHPVHLAA